ncbi:MAG: hypothetical protein E7615_07945 [Ruminococcaceae bacterium]|nr:hypothetical protein [Oscillospiraceae bacterium]
MKKVNLDKLTSADLIDHTAISEAFKNYLMKVLKYDEGEADFVVKNDFANPYETPYIMQDYEGEIEVDGKAYSAYSCHTDFNYCGLFHLANKKPFKFYMLIDSDDIADRTVGSYISAKKMYLI